MGKQKNDNRHLGRRVEFYIPDDEHDTMLAAMTELRMTNKSDFIRSAIKSFCDYQKSKKEVKTNE